MKKLFIILGVIALLGITLNLLSTASGKPQGNSTPPLLVLFEDICTNPNCNGLVKPEIDCVLQPPVGHAWTVNTACYQQCFDTYLAALIALKKQACDYAKQYEARWKAKIDILAMDYRNCKAQATTPEQVVQCRITFFEGMRTANKEYDDKMATLLAYYNLAKKNLEYACIDCGNHECCELVKI